MAFRFGDYNYGEKVSSKCDVSGMLPKFRFLVFLQAQTVAEINAGSLQTTPAWAIMGPDEWCMGSDRALPRPETDIHYKGVQKGHWLCTCNKYHVLVGTKIYFLSLFGKTTWKSEQPCICLDMNLLESTSVDSGYQIKTVCNGNINVKSMQGFGVEFSKYSNCFACKPIHSAPEQRFSSCCQTWLALWWKGGNSADSVMCNLKLVISN